MAARRDPILDAHVTIPEGVVRRAFPEETIVLNLQTGRYHGLNATAATMVEGLAAGDAPGQIAARIAEQAGQPVERVEADILALVAGLWERGLIEVDVGAA